MTCWKRVCLTAMVAFCIASIGSARSIDLQNLVFSPPLDPVNVITVTISTDVIGSDTDTAIVSGSMAMTLDFDLDGTNIHPTGLELTGGQIGLSDMSFSFVAGLVTATSTGVAGIPATPSPPSVVSAGAFDAADHTVLINQGMISAAGQALDLSANPFLGTGVGTGQIMVASNGAPTGNLHHYTATLSLPIEFSQPFTINDVPIFNTVNGTFSGTGMLHASQNFSLAIVDGDFDLDGDLDCEDLVLLEQAIGQMSGDLAFDANGDGLVDSQDELFWLSDLRGALPADANLDDAVDGADFLAWNSHKFQTSAGWCGGDWSLDGQADGQDFLIWNANKFTTASATVPVPEPGTACYFWSALLLAGMIRTVGPRRVGPRF